jgi:hypothetical protein
MSRLLLVASKIDAAPPRVPFDQLPTVPLSVQPMPKARQVDAPIKPPPSVPREPEDRKETAPSAGTGTPSQVKARLRASVIAVAIVGLLAATCAGAAAWFAWGPHVEPIAGAARSIADTSPKANIMTAESAVGITVASRTTQPAEGPKAEASDAKPLPIPAPPPTFNPTSTKVEDADETSRSVREPKPKRATARAATKAESKAGPPERQSVEDKATEKPATTAPVTTTATPPAGSVDALLQQQLRGAIP